MALFKFINSIKKGQNITLYNNGLLKRDFTYIDDIVTGIIKAIKSELSFEIINLGNSNPVMVIDVIKEIEKILDKKAQLCLAQKPENEMSVTFADITKAKKLLSWNPEVDFEAGLKRTVSWFLNNK